MAVKITPPSSASSSSLFQTFTQKNQAHFIEKKSELKHWRDFYEPSSKEPVPPIIINPLHPVSDKESLNDNNFVQLHNTYIVIQNDKGFLLIHQQNAHERILYEKFSSAVSGNPIAIQQSLFPSTFEVTAQDTVLLNELLTDLNQLGYLLEPFGNNTFVVQGTPADMQQGNEKITIEKMLEQYKHFSNDLKFSKARFFF